MAGDWNPKMDNSNSWAADLQIYTSFSTPVYTTIGAAPKDMIWADTQDPTNWQGVFHWFEHANSAAASPRNASNQIFRDQLLQSIIATDPPLGDIRWVIERCITIDRKGMPIRAPLVKLGYITNQELFNMDKYEQMHIMHMLTVGRAAGYITTDDGGLTYVVAEEF